MQIKNKYILITGANRGIGLGLAEALARKNCHLHLLIRKSDPQLVDRLKTVGALSVQEWIYDLSNPQQVEEVISLLQKEKIDILINNAGALTGGLLEEQKPEQIKTMFQTNLLTVIRLTQALIPQMIQQRSGKIVNNASVSAVMHFPGASTYAAAKAGVLAFTNCLELELKGTGVSTLCLLTPGVKTRMFDDIERQYGKNLEVPQQSISVEDYAQQVIKAIQNDNTVLYPQGSTFWGLSIAQHLPSLFKTAVSKKFKR